MQTTPAPLTRRQRQILDFYTEYVAEHRISPTLEEVAQHFGLNKVTIFGHVSELERKGALERAAKGVSRGFRVVTENEEAAESPRLPILGTIAAGVPIETVEDTEQLDFADLIPQRSDVYALRVQGNSMIEDAICDGDLVMIERRETANNGETVVAVLPDEQTTLKRFYREDGRIRLQPANASMEPIFVNEVEVRGVVIGVIRRL